MRRGQAGAGVTSCFCVRKTADKNLLLPKGTELTEAGIRRDPKGRNEVASRAGEPVLPLPAVWALSSATYRSILNTRVGAGPGPSPRS